MTFQSNWKPSRTARKKEQHAAKVKREAAERAEKAKVRKRDKVCRFPLCGCKKLGLRLEVSHDFHKGMGSKDGVSIAPLMVLLCEHRHQHGTISRHKGTLRSEYLTPDQYDGPVAWWVDDDVIARELIIMWSRSASARFEDGRWWLEVAREIAPGQLEPLTALQAAVLRKLAEMDL